jgi:hypothetical protein
MNYDLMRWFNLGRGRRTSLILVVAALLASFVTHILYLLGVFPEQLAQEWVTEESLTGSL